MAPPKQGVFLSYTQALGAVRRSCLPLAGWSNTDKSHHPLLTHPSFTTKEEGIPHQKKKKKPTTGLPAPATKIRRVYALSCEKLYGSAAMLPNRSSAALRPPPAAAGALHAPAAFARRAAAPEPERRGADAPAAPVRPDLQR